MHPFFPGSDNLQANPTSSSTTAARGYKRIWARLSLPLIVLVCLPLLLLPVRVAQAQPKVNITLPVETGLARGGANPLPHRIYAAQATALIVINEIMKDPDAVADDAGEWLELYNAGSAPFDLNGCTLGDDGTDAHIINNGGPLIINPGQFLVLGRNGDPGANGGVSVDYVYTGFQLANADDEVVLECGGVEVDRVNYDDGLTFPDPTGASMQLSDPALDNNIGANWCQAADPWPGSAGDRGTPGGPTVCATFTGTVVINEIMANPAAVPDANGEWIELYNPGSSPADLDGCILSDSVGNSEIINNPLIINPGQYLVLGKNGDTSANGGVTLAYIYTNLSFTLNNDTDDVVLECSGIEVDRVEYDDTNFPVVAGASMQLSAPSLDNNVGANWCEATTPWPGSVGDSGTPGAPSNCPADLVLNKTVSPGAVAPGQTLTYTLVYLNNGPAAATGVLIIDSVPFTLTNLSFISSGAAITPTGGFDFTWQVEDLSPGEGGTIVLSGVVNPDLVSDSSFINLATITSTAVDTPTTNNSGLAEVTVTLPRVSFSSSTYGVDEGVGAAIITATLDAVPFAAVTVNYATSDGTATAGSDYLATANTLTFTPGTTVMTFTVPIINDLVDEPDETINLSLSAPGRAILDLPSNASLTIFDNDGPPTLSINDVEVSEGDVGTVDAVFNVTLLPASSQTVTVDYATANGIALAPVDYTAIATTTLTFAPGVTSHLVTVTVQGDVLDESDETFLVNLTDASNATILDGQGVGTILDDDGPPGLSINDVSVVEGDAGTVDAVFSVSLSIAVSQTITVDYATTDGSAAAPADYTAIATTTLIFGPGVTTQPVSVTVQGDVLDEPDETFRVNLTNAGNATIVDGQGVGTIIDDDGLPTVQFSSSDFIVNENAGAATITTTLSVASALTVTVEYSSSNGTALAGSDYLTSTGTLTFTPGLTNQTFTVTIIDDGLGEPNEAITLTLGNPGNATLGTPDSATLTIGDDDALSPPAGMIYLPLITKDFALAPDLVGSFSLSPARLNFAAGEPVTITVVITNQGTATAGPFWADFFINPAPPPVAANTIWNYVCGMTPCYGLAWYVDTYLAPGQNITLTSTPGSYSAGHSIWPGAFAAGSTDLYLYVDSWNPGVIEGGVAESDETNNRAELHGLAVSGQPAAVSAQQSAADLPPRPKRP